MSNELIRITSFTEMIVSNDTQKNNQEFEIVINKVPTDQLYSTALFNKILSLPLSKMQAFIEFQCNLVNDKISWLNKFEKLLIINEDIFLNNRRLSIFNKLMVLINIKRTLLQTINTNDAQNKLLHKNINAQSDERIFCFAETKRKLNTFNSDNQKIIFLTQEIFEYQQSNINFINPTVEKFDVHCQKEIERIKTLHQLENELIYLGKSNPVNTNSKTKLKLNCNLNVFVDVLYQMQNELKEKGKPFLEATTQQIAEFVVDNFVDKDNQPISIATIRTILTPSKIAKRPKKDKQIIINKLLTAIPFFYYLLLDNLVAEGSILLDSLAIAS